VKKLAVAGSQTEDTSGLSCKCSATEPEKLDNHQPPQSCILTAQMVLNASVAHFFSLSSIFASSHLNPFISSVRQEFWAIISPIHWNKGIGCFNYWVVTDKLKRQWVWKVYFGIGHLFYCLQSLWKNDQLLSSVAFQLSEKVFRKSRKHSILGWSWDDPLAASCTEYSIFTGQDIAGWTWDKLSTP